MTKDLYFRSFSMLNTELGLVSNYKSILYDEEYYSGENEQLHSLLSNFYRLEDIPFADDHDLYFYLTDVEGMPLKVDVTFDKVYITGNIRSLEESTGDKRKSIFGNMGLASKVFLRALEKKGIYSFHSTSMYSPSDNRLYIVLGESGSGKSTVLLAGIREGLKLFGSELTHFRLENDDVLFYKGPLYQNCRVGNLVEDFPELINKFQIEDLPDKNIWNSYRSVYMGEVQTEQDILRNPEVVLIFPRIEGNRKRSVRSTVKTGRVEKTIFSSLSQKLSPPTLLYNKCFVPTVDNKELQKRRIEAVRGLISEANISKCWKVLASPRNCLKGIVT